MSPEIWALKAFRKLWHRFCCFKLNVNFFETPHRRDQALFGILNVREIIVLDNPLKLNLGCGDKILDGYLNVDIVDERAGKKPDVSCDITNLEIFESNIADEILAVHVIEHFWRWEVPNILREWVRVLKPNGKLVLECPNLISACLEVLRDPDNSTSDGPEAQQSMWPLYGDPRWQDPLMVHRWGYTPKSLAKLMHQAGLSNLKQESAQFKMREPRDMRITGIKLA